MPEMDGLELADVIKTKTLLGKPPVIMLTSLDNLIDQAARERLDSFCADGIYRYEERRDYPADGCTSRLSAHLKYGTIGIREVYAATAAAPALRPPVLSPK